MCAGLLAALRQFTFAGPVYRLLGKEDLRTTEFSRKRQRPWVPLWPGEPTCYSQNGVQEAGGDHACESFTAGT